MNKDITAIILAGGKSSRMGSDKSLLRLGKKTLIEHVVEALRPYVDSVLIVTNDRDKYSFLKNVNFTPDIEKNQGPFIGLISGVSAIETNWSFVTSCDMPLIDGKIIEYLWDRRNGYIVSPCSSEGYEPMLSLYSKEMLSYAKKCMEKNTRSINRFISQMDKLNLVKKIKKEDIVTLFGEKIFFNVNDYDNYNSLLEVFDGR